MSSIYAVNEEVIGGHYLSLVSPWHSYFQHKWVGSHGPSPLSQTATHCRWNPEKLLQAGRKQIHRTILLGRVKYKNCKDTMINSTGS